MPCRICFGAYILAKKSRTERALPIGKALGCVPTTSFSTGVYYVNSDLAQFAGRGVGTGTAPVIGAKLLMAATAGV